MNQWLYTRLCWLAILLAAFPAIPQLCAVEPEKVSLKLDWLPEVQFLGYFVAREKGFYAESGLIVTIISSESVVEIPEIPGRVAAGEFDFGIGSGTLILAQNKGIPIVALTSAFQYNPSALFALEETGIRSIREIKGHTIVVKGEAWRSLLVEFLGAVGMDISDVKEVPGGFDMTPFFERKIDIWTGFITNEVTLARLKGYKVVTFPLFEYGFTNLGASIYTTRRNVRENPELVRRFVQASIKGWTWAVNHPSMAVELFLESYPEKKPEAEFHHAAFNTSIPLIRSPGVPIGWIDCTKYLKKIILTHQDPGDFCTQRFVN